MATIAAFFFAASFLKELLTPDVRKNVCSITQEAALALEKAKRRSSTETT